jgi:hypothetical protein
MKQSIQRHTSAETCTGTRSTVYLLYLFLPCNWWDFCKKCTVLKDKNRQDQESIF